MTKKDEKFKFYPLGGGGGQSHYTWVFHPYTHAKCYFKAIKECRPKMTKQPSFNLEFQIKQGFNCFIKVRDTRIILLDLSHRQKLPSQFPGMITIKKKVSSCFIYFPTCKNLWS